MSLKSFFESVNVHSMSSGSITHAVSSQGDAKGLEEEEETAARPVPIWKATHITEILEDPVETEEEPTPPSPVVSRKGSKHIHTSITLV